MVHTCYGDWLVYQITMKESKDGIDRGKEATSRPKQAWTEPVKRILWVIN